MYFEVIAFPKYTEALIRDKEKITALRDAVIGGFVKEPDDCLRGVDVVFPVEDGAKDIFLRDFYNAFSACAEVD